MDNLGLFTEEELMSIKEERVIRDETIEASSAAAAAGLAAAVPFLASCAPAN